MIHDVFHIKFIAFEFRWGDTTTSAPGATQGYYATAININKCSLTYNLFITDDNTKSY